MIIINWLNWNFILPAMPDYFPIVLCLKNPNKCNNHVLILNHLIFTLKRYSTLFEKNIFFSDLFHQCMVISDTPTLYGDYTLRNSRVHPHFMFREFVTWLSAIKMHGWLPIVNSFASKTQYNKPLAHLA